MGVLLLYLNKFIDVNIHPIPYNVKYHVDVAFPHLSNTPAKQLAIKKRHPIALAADQKLKKCGLARKGIQDQEGNF